MRKTPFAAASLIAASAIAIACSTGAAAQDVKLKPIVDARLRYEGVDQAGLPLDADAVTLRLLAGVEATTGDFSALAEAGGTLAISERYNSGLNGRTTRPIVADPQNIELNRIQLQYRGIRNAVVTVGRQRINLDDQRFVGAVGWRQTEQNFDAVRVEWSPVKDLKLDATYSWSVRTIWGIEGGNAFGRARQQAIDGDNVLVNLGYKTKLGTLTGFAYLVDQDEAAISGFQLSSQTYGARFAGSTPLSPAAKLNYVFSYARQSDWHHNPNDYSADYYLGELGVTIRRLTLTGGYEVLGADRGVANTSFQTPLATLHKFQGWADKFLTTPPNGIRDIYGAAGYALPKSPLGPMAFTLAYHRYDSDRLSIDYGDEWNAQVQFKPAKRIAVLVKYADYRAKAFATDTRKLWLQLDYVL